MKISYILRRSDYYHTLAFFWLDHFRITRPLLFLLAFLAMTPHLRHPSPPIVLHYASILIAVVLFYAILLTAVHACFWLSRFLPTESGGILGTHTLEISDVGVSETTPVNSGTHSWTSVSDVTANEDYLFIILGRAMVHAVPRRAFTDDTTGEQFLALARRHWHAATGRSRT